MKISYRWVQVLSVVAVLFMLIWGFTPSVNMAGKRQEEVSAPAAVPSNAYRSPGERHKVAISDRALAQTLRKEGARVIADYGSYQLLEVSGASVDALSSNAGAQLADDNNLLLLNSGTIDTSSQAAQATRGADNSGAIDTGSPAGKTRGLGAATGSQMRLVQFAGPVQPEWYAALLKTGVRVVTYIPNNAYLVYGNSKSVGAVRSFAANSTAVQWDGAYTSAHRLDRAITSPRGGKDAAGKEAQGGRGRLSGDTTAKGHELFAIQLVADERENAATLALIEQLQLEPIVRKARVLDYLNIVVALEKDALINQIAERGDVVSIQPWSRPRKFDERQDMVMAGNTTGTGPATGDYLAYLTSHGFTTATTSFGVNVSDSGIDIGSPTPNHFGLYALGNPTSAANSRVVYARVVGTPTGPGSTTQGCDGHGNLNGHVVGGYVPTGTVGGVNFGAAPHADAQGFRYGLGVMPFVKLGSSVIFDNSGAATGDFTDPNYTDLESRAYNDTMRISSNSWGASSNAYSIDSQEYDALVRDAQPTGATVPAAGNQEYVIVFAAGNDGSGPGTVGLPGTAKNVITVGASEGVQAFGGADGCGTGDVEADSINDIVGFSGRGPTADGRRKPDIVAPGTHISGGVGQASIASPAGSGNGDDLTCFDATGVCAGPGGSDFFPTGGQQWYTASSGTSHSTPAISGFAALIRQHFINQSLTPPSPALTKALMMNTARYMTGTGANDSLFSNNQGMGSANFNNYFDTFTTGTVRRDQVAADKFTASGQQRTFTGTINTNSKPFRVTLAWTDTPGPTSGNAFVNNLDLEVIVGGNTYKGNVFSGANSATGGTADIRNNVESVIIPAGVSGNFLVRVKGTNIAGNGVPGDADALDQDFALVIYNATEANVAVVQNGTLDVTAESCAPADDAISPGETVTVDVPLTNVGTSATSNLVATLQATGGVTSPSGPQNYGVVPAGGTATRPFTFTADGSLTCGANITLTLHLQDGATDLGNVTYVVRLGTLGAASTATYSSGNVATAIPDNTTVEVPIAVSASGAVSDVNVRVRLNHTFDGDVTLTLVAPDGTEVVLSQNNDTALGGGDNYGTGANDCSGTPTIFDDAAATSITAGTPPFSGTFQPETPLSVLNGHSINGTWKLRVNDNATQDTGTVGCVTLEITRQPFVCCGSVGTPLVASGGAATITAESVTPANNAPDPGETVTISLPLINTGDGPTSNLVATLQSSGGITPITTSQNYGVVLPNGVPVSRNFTFVPSGACGSTVTATFQLQDGATSLGTVTHTFQLGTTVNSAQTFSSATAIVIPATGTGATTGSPATPYPSNITVSGVTNPVTAVRVTLKNMAHTFPDDVDVLLVGPTGRKFIVLSDAGDTNDWVSANITLDDAAASSLGDTASNQTGSFKPGNFGTVQDPFPAPAPAGPYLSPAPGGAETFASAFGGLDPNGTWSLYVVDDAATDVGTFAGGWDLTLVSSQSVCNSQACSLSCPANISVPPDGGPGGTSAVVNYPPAGVTGTCNVPNYSQPSGSTFPLGTTNVTVTGAGGASCSFSVTVGAAAPATPGELLISEFRLRGPSGANDEFVEIYNNTSGAHTVDGSGTGTGYAVAASDGVVRCTIPDGTVIPARGHYLCTNSAAYSLSGNATGNATYTTDIPDNAGIALFNTNVPAEFAAATRLDAVGSTSEANTLYKEGTGYPALTPFSIDYSFERDMCGKGGSITVLGACPQIGIPKDTNNNAVDFFFVDTNGTSAGAGQRLGAPGPENLASPIQRNSSFPGLSMDGTLSTSAPPNRVRDFTSDPANNSTFGTLDIRKRITNNTGGAITRLRFRIMDLTTFPAPSGFADLRPRTSTLVVVSGINDPATCLASNGVATTPCTINVQGTTLEQPPSQPNGGGFNSTLSAGTVTLGTPLANGASINVRFLLGIQQTGTFKFFVNVEALP